MKRTEFNSVSDGDFSSSEGLNSKIKRSFLLPGIALPQEDRRESSGKKKERRAT